MKRLSPLLAAVLLLTALPRLSAWWSQWTSEYYNDYVATVSADAFTDLLGLAEGSGYIQMHGGVWTEFVGESWSTALGSGSYQLEARIGPVLGIWAWAGYYSIDPLTHDGAWAQVYSSYHGLIAFSSSHWID